MMISSQNKIFKIAIFALCLATAGCTNTPWYKSSKSKTTAEAVVKPKGDIYSSEAGSTVKLNDKNVTVIESYFSAAGNDCLAYADTENLAKKRVSCRDNKGVTTEYKYLK